MENDFYDNDSVLEMIFPNLLNEDFDEDGMSEL
jgi:hypothetical protein